MILNLLIVCMLFLYSMIVLILYTILNSLMLVTLINIHIFYYCMILIFVPSSLRQNILHILLYYHWFMIISSAWIFIVGSFYIHSHFLFMFVLLLFYVNVFFLRIHPSSRDLFNYRFINFIASYHLLKISALQKIL